ncbi:MAG TPA: DUF2203 family protein [Gemmataceae bacterium]|nr:DUF2203 family protein [Gemmataceae bacterium]
MNRNRKGASRRQETIRPWTYAKARAALPYLASIVRSLREHRLEALRYRLAAQRLADRPGRPDRKALIAHEEALRDARQAEERFAEALAELEAIGVYCLHPVHGRALIPFVYNDQLAWFVYDLFDPEPLRFWRYHNDPIETRRPVTLAQKGTAEQTTPWA